MNRRQSNRRADTRDQDIEGLMSDGAKNRGLPKFDSFLPRPGNRPMFQLIPIGLSGLLCGFLGWRLGTSGATATDSIWFVVYFLIALSIAYTAHWVIYIMVIQAQYRNLMAYAEKLSRVAAPGPKPWDTPDETHSEQPTTQPPSSRQIH